MPVATSPTNFPQTANNRTLAELAQEVASYVGGETTGDGNARAAESVRAAVRRYNTWAWKCRRTTQAVTLAAQSAPHTYSLDAEFRSPVRCLLLDSNGVPQDEVNWVTPEEWRSRYPNKGTGGSSPVWYTAENPHLTGQVEFDPWPQGTLRYPSVRVIYSTFIAPPTSATSVLSVPLQLEQGIADMAVAIHTWKALGYGQAQPALARAEAVMLQLAADPVHGRDYGEIEVL